MLDRNIESAWQNQMVAWVICRGQCSGNFCNWLHQLTLDWSFWDQCLVLMCILSIYFKEILSWCKVLHIKHDMVFHHISKHQEERMWDTLDVWKCVETLSRVFDVHVSSQSKHPYVCQKYSAVCCILNSLLGVWKHSKTLCLVFDLLPKNL